jgi:hypothetical protein
MLEVKVEGGIELDEVLRLINSILVISSAQRSGGRYSVKLVCVTWFFYVLCDSRYKDPRFLLSSERVDFLHPKAEPNATGGDRPGNQTHDLLLCKHMLYH